MGQAERVAGDAAPQRAGPVSDSAAWATWRDAWEDVGNGLEHVPQHPMYAMHRDALTSSSLYDRYKACLKKYTDKGWVYAKHVMDPLPPFVDRRTAFSPTGQTWP